MIIVGHFGELMNIVDKEVLVDTYTWQVCGGLAVETALGVKRSCSETSSFAMYEEGIAERRVREPTILAE